MVSEVFSIPTGLNRLILDVDDPACTTCMVAQLYNWQPLTFGMLWFLVQFGRRVGFLSRLIFYLVNKYTHTVPSFIIS